MFGLNNNVIIIKKDEVYFLGETVGIYPKPLRHNQVLRKFSQETMTFHFILLRTYISISCHVIEATDFSRNNHVHEVKSINNDHKRTSKLHRAYFWRD